MKSFGKWLVGGLIALVVLAAVMLLLTFTVDKIGALAKAMAEGDERLSALGKVGIVIAGLFAPIVYAWKSVSEWFKSALRRLFPQSEEEARLASRTEELAKKIDQLRADVHALDEARAGELSRIEAHVKQLRADVAAGLGALASSDARVDALVESALNPTRKKTDAELAEEAEHSAFFFEHAVELTVEGGTQ